MTQPLHQHTHSQLAHLSGAHPHPARQHPVGQHPHPDHAEPVAYPQHAAAHAAAPQPGPPPASASAADREQAATATVDVRVQVIERLRQMIANFVIHAWESRYSDPLAPHCLAYLYLRPDPRRDRYWQLGTAWQLWLADPAVQILPLLLYDLHHSLAPLAAGPAFDPRRQLCTAADAHMQSDAPGWVYIGLAAISLDTPEATWEQAQRTARMSLDVGALTRVVLTDTTTMICTQAARTGYGTFTIASTQPLAYGTAATTAQWNLVDADQISTLDHDPETLRWLTELSDTLAQADNRRIDTLRHHAAAAAEAAHAKRSHRQ